LNYSIKTITETKNLNYILSLTYSDRMAKHGQLRFWHDNKKAAFILIKVLLFTWLAFGERNPVHRDAVKVSLQVEVEHERNFDPLKSFLLRRPSGVRDAQMTFLADAK